jgi:hypothetical protein
MIRPLALKETYDDSPSKSEGSACTCTGRLEQTKAQQLPLQSLHMRRLPVLI